jgi:hypothetical protein
MASREPGDDAVTAAPAGQDLVIILKMLLAPAWTLSCQGL